jgi:hypothetical protein
MQQQLEPHLPRRRRILHKIHFVELSAVDRPAQEGAVVTIMKRAAPEPVAVANLATRVSDVQARLDVLTTKAKKVPRQKEPSMEFEQRVEEIRRRDGCSGTEAFATARREHPEAFAAYRAPRVAKADGADYEALVDAEIAGSAMPRYCAQQRLLQKFGARVDAAAIRKSESAVCDFMAAVDAVMEAKGMTSRTAAMAEVRKSYPELYDEFQEV